MRSAAWLGLALVAGGVAWGQTAELSAARQREIAEQAALYSIDLTHGDWQHEPAAICPEFVRHSFVYYHRSPQPGVRTAFTVILPRQGGPAVLVPVTGEVDPKVKTAPESPATISAFNEMLSDELKHASNGSTLPGLTWSGLARCYAGILGEQPIVPAMVDPYVSPDRVFDLSKVRISSMLIPVTTTHHAMRAVSIKLDARGMVTGAVLSETIVEK
jgi:hypothetical protein